jgi:hypothetical protein
MYLLRAFLTKLILVLAIVSLILFLAPRFVDLEAHKTSVLKRLNSLFPGEVTVARAELTLVPRVGLRLRGASLRLKDATGRLQPFAEADDAALVLDLKSALADERRFELRAPSARVSLWSDASGRVNLPSLLASLSTPVMKPRSGGDPKARRSIFENVRLTGARLDAAEIAFFTPGSSGVSLVTADARIAFGAERWNAALRFDEASLPFARTLAGCDGRAPLPDAAVRLAADANGVAVESWSGAGTRSWSGRIGWDGRTALASGTSRLAGTISSPSCEGQGKIP